MQVRLLARQQRQPDPGSARRRSGGVVTFERLSHAALGVRSLVNVRRRASTGNTWGAVQRPATGCRWHYGTYFLAGGLVETLAVLARNTRRMDVENRADGDAFDSPPNQTLKPRLVFRCLTVRFE